MVVTDEYIAMAWDPLESIVEVFFGYVAPGTSGESFDELTTRR